jgi:glycosyltransferase involved in cell wall biosynthesis
MPLSSGPIVLLSDEPTGGAAVAAHRLAIGLHRLGAAVQSWFYPRQLLPDHPAPQVCLEEGAKRPWPERLLRNLSRPLAARLRHRRHERLLLAQVSQRSPALLHLHNLHACGLTHASLVKLPRGLPLVWTLHDCWAVEPWAFAWSEPNGQPFLTSPDPANPVQARANRAEFFAARPDTVLVAPSRWLAEVAREAVPKSVRVEVIPNGLPCDRFRPLDPQECRQQLGLPGQGTLLGFASAGFDPRKGSDLFLEAVKQLDPRSVQVVLWGDDAKWPARTAGADYRFGFVQDQTRLAQLYSACDLFVCPSRADNLPNTILESLACGTPVVASAAGGIPELVRPGNTGWLYGQSRVKDCAEALRAALQQRDAWPAYRARCRQIALNEFDLDRQAKAYYRLYESLLT